MANNRAQGRRRSDDDIAPETPCCSDYEGYSLTLGTPIPDPLGATVDVAACYRSNDEIPDSETDGISVVLTIEQETAYLAENSPSTFVRTRSVVDAIGVKLAVCASA